jgi:hypothetical protein
MKRREEEIRELRSGERGSGELTAIRKPKTEN